MLKLFLQITILLNLATCTIFSMEESSQKIISPNGTLFIDKDKNLKLIRHELNLLEDVVEIIKSPNEKLAVAIVVEKDFERHAKTTIYLINFEKIAGYFNGVFRTLIPFSKYELGTIKGEYFPGNCEVLISENSIKVTVLINDIPNIYTISDSYLK